ncbi:MAG TPA: hypothetical protein ENI42_02405 [Thermoplasmatales archaeon]|nr:hypothetical protein [Thermoplasmatales archaeon]
MNEVFTWDSINDTFRYSGRSYLLEEIRAKLDLSREELQQELNNRVKVIRWAVKKGIYAFRDVSQLINEYVENPEELIKRVESDA